MDFFTIDILGEAYDLRPNFKTAAGIQNRSGKTLAEVVFSAKALSVTDLHTIMCAALKAGGHNIDEMEVGEAIMEDYRTHTTELINAICDFADGFFPKVESEGTKKPKAATKKAG